MALFDASGWNCFAYEWNCFAYEWGSLASGSRSLRSDGAAKNDKSVFQCKMHCKNGQKTGLSLKKLVLGQFLSDKPEKAIKMHYKTCKNGRLSLENTSNRDMGPHSEVGHLQRMSDKMKKSQKGHTKTAKKQICHSKQLNWEQF